VAFEVLAPTSEFPGGGWLTWQRVPRGENVYRYAVGDGRLNRTCILERRIPRPKPKTTVVTPRSLIDANGFPSEAIQSLWPALKRPNESMGFRQMRPLRRLEVVGIGCCRFRGRMHSCASGPRSDRPQVQRGHSSATGCHRDRALATGYCRKLQSGATRDPPNPRQPNTAVSPIPGPVAGGTGSRWHNCMGTFTCVPQPLCAPPRACRSNRRRLLNSRSGQSPWWRRTCGPTRKLPAAPAAMSR